MANSFLSLCLLVILLLLGIATAMTPTAAAENPLSQLHGKPDLQPNNIIPKVTGCWKSILQVESCTHDILQSLAFFDVHVSKVCCNVLEKIGDKCFHEIFSKFPFNPLYPPLVKHICGFAVAPRHGA